MAYKAQKLTAHERLQILGHLEDIDTCTTNNLCVFCKKNIEKIREILGDKADD